MRSSLLTLLATLLLWLPAAAREAVIDEAKILDARSMQQVQRLADDIRQSTGKDLLVVTVDQVQGSAPQHAQQLFRQHSLNGVLIYIAPRQHELGILPGNNTAQLFPRNVTGPIREAMLQRFRQNNYPAGVVEGVQRIRSVFANAPAASRGNASPAAGGEAAAPVAAEERRGGGFGWWPLLLLIGGAFLLFRMFRRRSSHGHGYGHGYEGRGGYGHGQGRYGHPYPAGAGFPVGGGQGGGFFSGMLGGLGGAILGNAIYDQFRPDQPQASDLGGGGGDAGWGAADSGLSSSGDFGGGDLGGGDFGGGGGDSW